MNNAQEIIKEVERHSKAMKDVVAALKQTILDLPDNPRIKRFPGNPHCFVMSSKHLGDNWSVAHHDFRQQYKLVVQELEGSPDLLVEKLLRIVNEGKVKIGETGRQTVRLHEDVIQHLSALGGFRWVSHVKWQAGTCPSIGDESEDQHSTKKAAEAVCRTLERDGFGGNCQKFPVKTSVRAVIASNGVD